MRNSARATLMIDHDDWRKAATAKPGQGVPVQAIKPAATFTAMFPSFDTISCKGATP
jgi:hypothetical protein